MKYIAFWNGIILASVASSCLFMHMIGGNFNNSLHAAQDTEAGGMEKEKVRDRDQDDNDTSVIIVSSLTNMAPEIYHTALAIDSLVFVKGLSPTPPIYIMVDGLTKEQATEEEMERLDAYIWNLRMKYMDMPNVHIIPFIFWQMHNNLIHQAMQLVKTEYVYVIEHDEAFVKPIDHHALIATMEDRPDEIRKVEFNRKNNTDCNTHYYYKGRCSLWSWPSCNVTTTNGIQFTKHSAWSDQAHLTTKKYYEKVFEIIGVGKNDKTHPELRMSRHARKHCEEWGAHFYGNYTGGVDILHYDGRGAYRKDKADFAVVNATVHEEIVRVHSKITGR